MNNSHTHVNNASFKCAVDFHKPFFLVKNSEKKSPKTSGASSKRGCDRPFAVRGGSALFVVTDCCSCFRIGPRGGSSRGCGNL